MKDLFRSILDNEIDFRQLLIDKLATINPNNQILFGEKGEYQTVQHLTKDDRTIIITSFVNYQYFEVEYWQQGTWLAEGKLETLEELVQSIDQWMNSEIEATELAHQFVTITANECAAAFEEDREVEYKWNWMLEKVNKNLLPFLQVASKDAIVSKLYPYLQIIHASPKIEKLCFSYSTGLPYTIGIPYIIFSDVNENYKVYSANEELIGSGDAEKVLDIFKKSLSPNI